MAEKHDEATAKLMSYEELLAAKNDELSKLKKELGQAKASLAERTSESETIAILRAQVKGQVLLLSLFVHTGNLHV